MMIKCARSKRETANTSLMRLTATDPTRLPALVVKIEVTAQQTAVSNAATSPIMISLVYLYLVL